MNEESSDQRLKLEDLLNQLERAGIVNAQQTAALRASAAQRHADGRHPLIVLADQGWQSATKPAFPLTLERLTRWLADTVGLPYYRIDPLKIDVETVTRLVSQAYASRFHFLPVEVIDTAVTVATAEPFVRGWEDEIARILKRRILRVVANPKDIERYRVEMYGVSRSISGATRAAAEPSSRVGNFEQLTELGRVGEPDANDQHIVHLVDWLLQYAFEQRASDIHIEPRRDQGNVRFRIDGVLHLVNQLPMPVITAISSRLKSLGRMDVADRRRPQDGRIRTKSPAGEEVELRLSTMPTTFGEKLVMRIFDPTVLSRSFAELGFTEHDLTLWSSMTSQPHGIILVTGPTGSGKTTTLYSALRHLARPELNVCTIEDPIEMVEPQFNQMQVQPQIGLDFATGVRTLMRQDPDIIMVGEIRDRETAGMAIQAALTGHLVLSTLHTNDAPSAITRIMDIGVPPYLLAATVLGIVAQRLVRTLCAHCKTAGSVDADTWAALIAPESLPLPASVMTPVGCDECRHTGYLGRVGLYEMLIMSTAVRELVHPEVSTQALRRAAVSSGMRRLRLAGAYRVAAGLTTPEEVFSVVPAAEDAAFS
ncbi:MAG: type II/IV secretion system protein [Gammaproteobacteria bacterium]|nr:type II/IV secretion system protein [Gammaproteobacteria bacterium]